MPLPTIPSGNVASALGGGFEVANSCRFDGSSSYLSAGSFGTATSGTTWTFSLWVKRSEISSANYICGSYDGSRTNSLDLVYDAADTLSFYHGSNDGNGKLVKPARLFRDPSAWTHVVWSVDTTQGTAANRVKVYFNGVEDAKATATYPDEDAVAKLFADTNNKIGSQWNATSGTIFDGYMAEVVFIDGQALTPTSFGEYDEDSPQIWKPIDVSGLTFGNNGFYLDFEDSSALGNDVSGNNNDFSTSGLAATDQSTDTCTNNFATMNPLDNYYAASVFSEGNTTVDMNVSGNETYNTSTIGVSKGKWYAEVKLVDSSTKPMTGIVANHPVAIGTVLGNAGHGYGYMGEDGKYKTNSTNNTYGTTYTTNDIISIALDLDNNKLYFAKNNSWQNSGDPTSGSTGTGAISITAPSSNATGAYFFAAGKRHSDNNKVSWNFGSPPYSVSSGNADGNGYGNFEYAPPSGYLALCTKNLGSDGG